MKDVKSIQKFEKFGSVLGLERICLLMDRLGNPEKNMRFIHIAGTNGKGSVSRYLYEILLESGKKPGLFISPFLEKFNERIEYNGSMITDDEIARISERVVAEADKMVEEGLESPTEFEIITAMAFLYFSNKKADPVILEVGLGGRGDSTNIIENPLVTVFTSISYDHMDRLGDTIEQIAFEKAGIIKPGCTSVSGVRNPKAEKVLRDRADELNGAFVSAHDGKVTILKENLAGTKFLLEDDYIGGEYEISMPGRHQVENALTALKTIQVLEKDIVVSPDAIKKGLKKAKQPGRLEIIKEKPLIILDGAHNEDGARVLKDTVKNLLGNGKVLTIAGMLRDKDIEAITDNFLEFTEDFVITEPDNERKLSNKELAKIISAKGGNVIKQLSPEEAVAFALSKEAEAYDAIIFAGSLYLIGTVRRLLENE